MHGAWQDGGSVGDNIGPRGLDAAGRVVVWIHAHSPGADDQIRPGFPQLRDGGGHMLVVIRGAGDIATGIALRLWRAHIGVVMTDLEAPTAIRRTVCFSQAIVYGETAVEDVPAKQAASSEEALRLLGQGVIPVLADPEGKTIPALRPDAVVDAILAKKNLGTRITDAPVVIGVGPGFTAGTDCHAVVETMIWRESRFAKGSPPVNT